MEIIGKIIHKLDPVSGTSSRGNLWKKQEYVLETEEQYPKKVFFDFFGDKADQYQHAIGDRIKLYFDIESREWNGRWFTQVRGWKSEKVEAGAQPEAPTGVNAPAPEQSFYGAAPTPPPAQDFSGDNDDLPF